jgi:hypothetical protein
VTLTRRFRPPVRRVIGNGEGLAVGAPGDGFHRHGGDLVLRDPGDRIQRCAREHVVAASAKWNGTNTVSTAMPDVTRARAVIAPRRDRIRTRWRSVAPRDPASAGCSSTTASGTHQSRPATRQVIVPRGSGSRVPPRPAAGPGGVLLARHLDEAQASGSLRRQRRMLAERRDCQSRRPRGCQDSRAGGGVEGTPVEREPHRRRAQKLASRRTGITPRPAGLPTVYLLDHASSSSARNSSRTL